jgi:hypothetical protein
MKNASLEQNLQQQVRDEIGDDENIKFPQKNILLQKFGVIPPVLLSGWDQVAEDYDGRA